MAAGLGYKEFATGDILTAADANGYLASQAVMVFASASARTSAIASPQEGMISYLKDTNSTEYYSGSAWVAIGGSSGALTLIGTTTLSGSGAFNISNVFSSTYDDYEIHFSGIVGSTSSYLTWGLRTGSTNATGSDYSFYYSQISTAGSLAQGGGSGTTSFGSFDYGTSPGDMIAKINRPFLAATTGTMRQYCAYNANGVGGSQHTLSNSYESLWVSPTSGTISGKVMVYGYAK
jgi:hypothetical protein